MGTNAEKSELRGYLRNRPDWHTFAFLNSDPREDYGENVAEWLDNFPDGSLVTITVEVPAVLDDLRCS